MLLKKMLPAFLGVSYSIAEYEIEKIAAIYIYMYIYIYIYIYIYRYK